MLLFKLPSKSVYVKRKGKKAAYYHKMSHIRNTQYDFWAAIIKQNYEGHSFSVNVENNMCMCILYFHDSIMQ